MNKRLTGVNTGLLLRLLEGEPGGEPSGGGGEKPPDFQPITTQADLDRVLGDRLRRERDKYGDYADLKRKAEAHDAAEAEKLSEVEKATTRATTAETRAEKAERESLTLRVAMDKQLPAALAGRLTGSTREELEADADALLALVQPGQPQRTGPQPDPHRHKDPTRKPLPGEAGRAAAARRGYRKTDTDN